MDDAAEIDRVHHLTERVIASRKRLSPLAEEIGRKILSRHFPPGTSLNERMFGEARGISRTSFREAIKVLESKGLVQARQNVGTQVTPQSRWHLLDPEVLVWRLASGDTREFLGDFFEFRRFLEPEAAESAARHADEAGIARVRAAFDTMARLENDQPFADEYVQADVAFHAGLFSASGNQLLASLAYILEMPLLLSFTLTSSLGVGPSNRLMLHEELIRSVEAGDPPRARDASLALLSDVAHDVQRILSENATNP